MQVAKWGNSLAIRLPAAAVEALGVKEGDEIEIHTAAARDFAVARKPGSLTEQPTLLSKAVATPRLGT
jgi:antitoxin MazE